MTWVFEVVSEKRETWQRNPFIHEDKVVHEPAEL